MCQAIDTIVKQRLSEIKFDETILCTIVGDSKREFGCYRVQYGNLIFEAFGEKNYYFKGEQIYVLIPKGDYTQQKIILSKYIKEGK